MDICQNLISLNKNEEISGLMTVVGDLLHYGHGIAAKQAKKFCDKLFIGVHPDDICEKNKRKPIMLERERYLLFGAIRWVDQIIEDIPWNMTCKILDKYNCHLGLHGDDISLNIDGVDSYEEVRRAQRFIEFQRTKNISTKDVVNRVLNSRCGLSQLHSYDIKLIESYKDILKFSKTNIDLLNLDITCYYYGNKILMPSYPEGDALKEKRVYTSGVFDIFNSCHLELLINAAQDNCYLIVNVLSDEEANRIHDQSCTILSISERVLLVLQIKHVSMVVVGCPIKYDLNLCKYLNAQFVEGEYNQVDEDKIILAKKFNEKKLSIINQITNLN